MKNAQSGFTIIELLTVIVIMGILSGISLQTLATYRENAFYASSEQGLANARKALDAGRAANEEIMQSRIYWVQSYTGGRVTTMDGPIITPGLVNNARSYVYVYHNPTCNSEWCLSDYIQTRNCRSEEYTYWYRYAGGYAGTVEHVNAAGADWMCP